MAKLFIVMNCENNGPLNILQCLGAKLKAVSHLTSQTVCPLVKHGM